MALVAYDNSDSSEVEDDEPSIKVIGTKDNNVKDSKSFTELENKTVESSSDIFKLLPQTKQKSSMKEVDDEFLQKKATILSTVKQKARITVPSLSDFKDVEDSKPTMKPRVASGKSSGLLSILPQPKYSAKSSTQSFIPNSVKQKVNIIPTHKQAVKIAPESKAKNLALEYSDDDSEDEGTDFFSINKKHYLPVVPLDIDEPCEPKVQLETKKHDIQSYFKPMETEEDSQTVEDSSSYESTNNIAAESSMELDDEAIRQLCGARGVRKKENIQIVDVNQRDMLAGAREMLLKGLMDDTTARVSHKKRGDEPTNQQRRKHQITYLAHQAKANEAELQNKWANSRMSRRQTQSKYGF